MAIPSLSEILGQPTSPDLSTTAQGTSFDLTPGMQQVFQAAAMKQQADWQRYTQFTKNIQDFMADANKINAIEIAPEDRKVITQRFGEFMKDAKNNLSAIANPMANPAAYSEIMRKGGEVMSLAVKSKTRHAYDMLNDKYIKDHAEWNTPANREIIKSSFKTDIDSWQPYQLSGPAPAFDIMALAEEMNKQSAVPFAESFVGGMRGQDGKIGKGSEYLYKREGTRYDPELFDKQFEGAWTRQDKYGNLFSQWAETFVWNPLHESEKQKYVDMGGDPIKNAALDFVRNYRKPDAIKETMDDNPVWTTKTREAGQTQRARITSSNRGPAPTTQGGGGGNALDSIRNQVTQEGVTIDGGMYMKGDTKFTGTVTIPRREMSDEIVSVISAANPGYFGKKKGGGLLDRMMGGSSGQVDYDMAQIDVKDGVAQAIRFGSGGDYNAWVNRGTFGGAYQPAYEKKNTKAKGSAEFGNNVGGGPANNNDPLGIND
jgi:hypothetical protein